jgi:hypothetical protein
MSINIGSSNLQLFTNKENIHLLWDVLLDELNVNTNNKGMISNIKSVFESNVKPFTSRANSKAPIMELNKLFLGQVVLAVNRLFPQLKQEQNIKKITITNEEIAEPYRIEDIQTARQSEFENAFEKKRMELDTYMTPQKPKSVDFTDKFVEEKITGMDSLLVEKMNQRNLEIGQIMNNSGDTEKWLKSKETSVKSENINANNANNANNTNNIQQQNNRLKYINMDNTNNIALLNPELNKPAKRVTWDERATGEEEPVTSIFQKLKKTNIEQTPINEKQYTEQKSAPLPDIKQEVIQRNSLQQPIQTPLINPIVPNNEIIKHLNDVNQKVDNLTNLVNKLINDLQINKSTKNQSTETDIIEI